MRQKINFIDYAEAGGRTYRARIGSSSPSVTEVMTHRVFSPRSTWRRATMIADIPIIAWKPTAGRSSASPRADHVGIEMAAASGVDLNDRRAGGLDALTVATGGLVAFDHEEGWDPPSREPSLKQRRLASAGALRRLGRGSGAGEP